MIEQKLPEATLVHVEARQAHDGRQTTPCLHCGTPNAMDSRFCVNCGQALRPLAATTSPPRYVTGIAPPAPVPADVASKVCGCPMETICVHDRLAGFGPRLLAFLIDALLIGIASSLLRSLDLRAVASLVDAAYFIAFWSTTGQTVGMRALRLKVVRSDGQPLSWVTGLLRYVGYILSLIPFCLGLLWVIWDPRKQGWHDKIASTLVVGVD